MNNSTDVEELLCWDDDHTHTLHSDTFAPIFFGWLVGCCCGCWGSLQKMLQTDAKKKMDTRCGARR